MAERVGEKERFLQDMIRRIATGRLTSGTKLPTESELAEEYGIAKTNIHLGIKELERFGFVTVVPRHAVYIADMNEQLTLDGLNIIFRYVDGLPSRAAASALLELREMMAFGVMRWMTRHPDRAHMERLRECCAALEQAAALGSTEAVYPALMEFMKVFYRDAGNAIFPLLVRSFQAKDVAKRENFVSLLYWLGITTITGDDFGLTEFGVPNETMKQIASKMIPDAYADVYKIDERMFDVNRELVRFARRGEWQGFVGILSKIVQENFAVRDAVEGEKVVQSSLVTLLCAAGGPYFVRHERESGGGFYDIALAPQLDRWPEIAHAALIEMKYVKAGDPNPTPEQLTDIKSKAIEQLDQYSADPALSASWRLKEGNGKWGTGNGTVELHRLVMVFHGGECVLAESV